MSDNPYSPPKAKLVDQPKPPMAGWKAVLLGMLVDVGGSSLVGSVFVVCYITYMVSQGVAPEQIQNQMSHASPTSWFSISIMLIGATLSILGGMVCTRCARRSNYSLGLVMASLSALLGLALSYEQYTVTMNLLMTLLTFTCVMLGTRFGQVKSKIQTAPSK